MQLTTVVLLAFWTTIVDLSEGTGLEILPRLVKRDTSIDQTGVECPTPCQNNGVCIDPINNICQCPHGYAGDSCDIVMCNSIRQCANGGYCYQPDKCHCPAAYTARKDPYCRISSCNPVCLNGGVCTMSLQKFVCSCPLGYSGDDCSQDETCLLAPTSGYCAETISVLIDSMKDSEAPLLRYCRDYLMVLHQECSYTNTSASMHECQQYCDPFATSNACDKIFTVTPTETTCGSTRTAFHFNGVSCVEYQVFGCGLGPNMHRTEEECLKKCALPPDANSEDELIIDMNNVNAPLPNTCYASGWGHYSTFDGLGFNFFGSCPYIMLNDKDQSSRFQVILTNNPNCSHDYPCQKSVQIQIDASTLVELGAMVGNWHSVKLNGNSMMLPYNGKPQIRLVGRYVLVITPDGTYILWDGINELMIRVPDYLYKYKNRLSGLCGNYDGVQSNDLTNPLGQTFTNTSLFAVTWSLSSCLDVNLAPPPFYTGDLSKEDYAAEVDSLCSQITSTPFEQCLDYVDHIPFQKLCIQDTALCNFNKRKCYCSAFAMYARACRLHSNLTVDWRSPDLCGVSCPETMEYSECASACPLTCKNMLSQSFQQECPVTCVEGCHCPDGLWFDSTNSRCVMQHQCPCYYNDVAYENGETIQKPGCETCQCQGGMWSCTKESCPGTCSIIGDPHITTFDGKLFSMYGKCSYVLAEHCRSSGPKAFELIVKNSDCVDHSNDFTSCARQLHLYLPITSNHIFLGSNRLESGQVLPTVTVDGKEVYRDESGAFVIEHVSRENVIIHAHIGLQILWTGHNAYITVHSDFFNSTCGLCGTYNGISTDDFHSRTFGLETSIASFSREWISLKDTAMPVDQCHTTRWETAESPCKLYSNAEPKAIKQCSLISDPEGPFRPCHDVISPLDYYRLCKEDACKCDDCHCEVIASYAKACADHFVFIMNWRELSTSCSKRFRCEDGKILQQCNLDITSQTLRCPQTCFDLTQNTTETCLNRGCVEACYCPPGFYENDAYQCVTQEQCPCIHRGIKYNAGDVRKDGCNLCTCKGGKFECTSDNCVEKCLQKGLVYKECGLTCSSLWITDSKRTCDWDCYCPNGLALHENGTCVSPTTECQCRIGDKYYDAGQTSPTDCSKRCKGDRSWETITGAEPVPEYQCSAFGQMHYKTFDGRLVKLDHKMCEYVMVTDCFQASRNKICDLSSSNFNVRTKNVFCEDSLEMVYCKRVSIDIRLMNGEMAHVTLRQKEILVQWGSSNMIFLPGNYTQPNTFVLDGLEIFKMGIFIIVRAAHLGYMVKFDTASTLQVVAGSQHKSRNLAGLCGNFDGSDLNDMQLLNGGSAETEILFAQSWSDNCPDLTLVDTCKANPERVDWAHKGCDVLRGGNFTACHGLVSPDDYVLACMQETCLCKSGGDCACFCGAVAAYVHECNRLGVEISWRREGFCQLQCCEPCNSGYGYYTGLKVPESCGSSNKTCSPGDRCCRGSVVEGCGCPPGQYHNGIRCVDVTASASIPCPAATSTTSFLESSKSKVSSVERTSDTAHTYIASTTDLSSTLFQVSTEYPTYKTQETYGASLSTVSASSEVFFTSDFQQTSSFISMGIWSLPSFVTSEPATSKMVTEYISHSEQSTILKSTELIKTYRLSTESREESSKQKVTSDFATLAMTSSVSLPDNSKETYQSSEWTHETTTISESHIEQSSSEHGPSEVLTTAWSISETGILSSEISVQSSQSSGVITKSSEVNVEESSSEYGPSEVVTTAWSISETGILSSEISVQSSQSSGVITKSSEVNVEESSSVYGPSEVLTTAWSISETGILSSELVFISSSSVVSTLPYVVESSSSEAPISVSFSQVGLTQTQSTFFSSSEGVVYSVFSTVTPVSYFTSPLVTRPYVATTVVFGSTSITNSVIRSSLLGSKLYTNSISKLYSSPPGRRSYGIHSSGIFVPSEFTETEDIFSSELVVSQTESTISSSAMETLPLMTSFLIPETSASSSSSSASPSLISASISSSSWSVSATSACPACYWDGRFFNVNETVVDYNSCMVLSCEPSFNPCFDTFEQMQIVRRPITCACSEVSKNRELQKCCQDYCTRPKTCAPIVVANEYLQLNNCISTNPVPITGCAGACEGGLIIRGLEEQTTCSCCRPTVHEKVTVSMLCDDAQQIVADHSIVVQCGCKAAACIPSKGAGRQIKSKRAISKKNQQSRQGEPGTASGHWKKRAVIGT